jgi:hypothetical protein
VASGNYITFDVDAGGASPGGTVNGLIVPVPPVPPRPPLPPIVNPPVACTAWAMQSANGVADDNGTFTLPVGSCQGTIIFTSTEGAANGGSGTPDWGYELVSTADGNPLLNTGCLVNNASSVIIPEGTTSIVWAVTGGCAGAGVPGEWVIQITTP